MQRKVTIKFEPKSKPKSDKKNLIFAFRGVTAHEANAIRIAAKKSGLTISRFCYQAVMYAIKNMK